MSSVYDYLKQIKESKEPAKDSVKAEAPAGGPQKPKARISRWIKLGLVFVLCLGIGLGVYFLAPRAVKPIVKLYHPPVVTTAAPSAQSSDPSYVLEGIIYNPAQPFAIINGKMLETKGMIGDFQIEKITPDSVMLRNTKDNTSRTIHL